MHLHFWWFFILFSSLSFLTIDFTYHKWRNDLRLHYLEINAPSMLTRFLRRIFYNLPIISNIGGSFLWDKIFKVLVDDNGYWNLLRVLPSWKLRKAPKLLSTSSLGNHLSCRLLYIIFWIIFCIFFLYVLQFVCTFTMNLLWRMLCLLPLHIGLTTTSIFVLYMAMQLAKFSISFIGCNSDIVYHC